MQVVYNFFFFSYMQIDGGGGGGGSRGKAAWVHVKKSMQCPPTWQHVGPEGNARA